MDDVFENSPMQAITPRAPLMLAGRVGPERVGYRIADELEVNAICLPGDRGGVALVGVDALFCSRDLAEKVSSAGADRFSSITLISSHTHNAPSLDPEKPGLGRSDADHISVTAEAIAGSLAAAQRDSRQGPLTIERGRGYSSFNVCRRRVTLSLSARPPFLSWGAELLPNPAVEVPHALDVVVARAANGEPRWAIWTWCCHATACDDLCAVSSDFPGAVRRHIRTMLESPRLPVIYLPGFAGDVRPLSLRGRTSFKSRLKTPFARPFSTSTPEDFSELCESLADAATAAIEQANPQGALSGSATAHTTEVPLTSIMETNDQRGMGITRIEAEPLNFLLMGAETCSPYQKLIGPILPEGTLMSGYAGSTHLYLPDDKQIAQGGYEVEGFRKGFGLDGEFRASVQNRIVESVAELERRFRRGLAAQAADGRAGR